MNRISLALTRIETKNAGGTETKENPCFLPIYFVGFVEWTDVCAICLRMFPDFLPNIVEHRQTSSNIIKHHQTSSNIIKHHQTLKYVFCRIPWHLMSVGLFRKFMFRAARQGTLKQITLETCKHLHKLLLFGFKVTMERPTTIKISKRFKMPRGLQNIPAKTIFNPIYKSNAVFFPYWILIPFTIGQSSLYPVSAWVFQLVFSWPSELPWLRADAEAFLFKGVPLGQDPRATCSGTEPEKKNLRTNSQTFFFL